MGYFVPTTEGQQGPFEVDQLQRFVDRGKLPLDLQVVHEDSGLRVDLSMICDEPSAEAPPPAPTPPPAPSRRPQSTRAAAPAAAGRRPAPAGRATRGRRGAPAGFQRKSSATPMVAALLIAVGLAVGAVLYLRPPALFGAPYLGTWVIDEEATTKSAVASQGSTLPEGIEGKFQKEMFETMVKGFISAINLTMIVTETTITNRAKPANGNAEEVTASYTVTDLGGDRYRFTTEGTIEPFELQMQGSGQLELFNDGGDRKFGVVMVRR